MYKVYMYICICVYVYICIRICGQRGHDAGHGRRSEKGRMGSALMGSLQMFTFFDRGTFWAPICQTLSTSVQIYQICIHVFRILSKNVAFAATLLVSTPFVRSQGRSVYLYYMYNQTYVYIYIYIYRYIYIYIYI